MPPFPGAVIEWETEDYADAFAELILEGEEQEAIRIEQKRIADEKAELLRRSRMPPGTQFGGGAPPERTSAHPIETPMLDEGEEGDGE